MSTFFATSPLVVSPISLLITIWLWRESNRAVVVARIKTHDGGNAAILYNVEVVNAGTRPAKNVRLSIDPQELERSIIPAAHARSGFENDFRSVERCFAQRAAIPVLLSEEVASNFFGHTSTIEPFWVPGSVLNLTISYQGLEGQSYCSRLPIRIDDTAGFAGSFYE